MKNSRIALALVALAALAATGFSTAQSNAAPTAKDCCAAGSSCCAEGAACCGGK
jgi:hypothetical protein